MLGVLFEALLFWFWKAALTDMSVFNVMIQLPVPVHAPPQPVSPEFVFGAAERVTVLPDGYEAVQDDPHELIPAGLLDTVPGPLTLTERI